MSTEKRNKILVFEDFSAILKRTNRKDVEIQIKPDNSVIIFAPISAKLDLIRRLVDKKVHWIQAKRLAKAHKLLKQKKEYIAGESFLLFGENYSLHISNHSGRSNLIHDGKKFLLKASGVSSGEKWFTSFYKKAAKDSLIPRAENLAKTLGYKTTSVRVLDLGARWGSCTRVHRINLNWRLALLPKHIADYIIVHELTHIEAKGHDIKFWRKVERSMPNYRDAQRWLMKNGHKVVF
jgi:predicted metal-dependent hydrolase